MSDKDPLLSPGRRKNRRISPLVMFGLVVGGLAGLAALWIWVFTPIFVTPIEFHQRQRAFDRALREVLQARGEAASKLPPWPASLNADRQRMLACAEAQVVRAVRHTPNWQQIDYPWGDVAPHLGTSADLMVRCLRSLDLDLQQMLHLDRKTDPKRYPLQLLTKKQPDKSMDHRRVAFLFVFAKDYLPEAPLDLETPEQATLFVPGDIVFWDHGGREGYPGLLGIVLDRRDASGMPLAATLVPEDGRASGGHRLDEWPLVGHFTLDVDKTLERFLEKYPGAPFEPRPVIP